MSGLHDATPGAVRDTGRGGTVRGGSRGTGSAGAGQESSGEADAEPGAAVHGGGTGPGTVRGRPPGTAPGAVRGGPRAPAPGARLGGSHAAGFDGRYERRRPGHWTPRRRARRRNGTGRHRARRALVLLLGCLPGAAVALVLAFCAVGAAPTGARSAHPAPTRNPATAPAHAAARPVIVPRARWAGEGLPAQPPPRYDDRVVAVFVHHTDSPNGYDCADAPRIIRALYQGQTSARQWDDIGYNFLVDRCGTIYEGRAGGVDRPVTGAHTQGFNHRTAGIAAIGTFTAGTPVPPEMTEAIAALAAWKLGLSDVDPRSRVALVSSNGGSRYAAGATAVLPAVAGHDAGYQTSCPGAALSARLEAIRARAARLQGRT